MNQSGTRSKKEKLTTFVNNNKTAKVKIDNKDV